MKKKAIRSLVVMLIAVLFVSMMPVTANAATKKPGKVKITSIKFATVSTKNNQTTVTVKWKKASNAKKYVIYARHDTGEWQKIKTCGKSKRSVKFKASAGQIEVKIQAVNKKKKGKFSTQAKFIPSPLKLVDYVNRVEPSLKSTKIYNGKPSFSGNTLTLDYDLAEEYPGYTADELDDIAANYTVELKSDLMGLKNSAQEFVTIAKTNAGITGVKVVARYVYKNKVLTSVSF